MAAFQSLFLRGPIWSSIERLAGLLHGGGPWQTPPPPFSRFTSQAPPPPSTLALGRREGKGPMDEGGSNNPPPSIGAGGFMAHTQRAAPSPPQPGAAQPS
jgi:hypothetical protein